jgi:hypothetical protein
MLELTTTDNATLELKETTAKLTLPVVEIKSIKSASMNVKVDVKDSLLKVIGEMIDVQLAKL